MRRWGMEQYVWYAFSGTDSVLENGKDDARILIIQGQKLREPEGMDSVIQPRTGQILGGAPPMKAANYQIVRKPWESRSDEGLPRAI